MPKIQEEPDLIDNGRAATLAVNLFDLDYVPEEIRLAALHGKLDLTEVVRVNQEDPTQVALAFYPNKLSLLSAACLCDIVRHKVQEERQESVRVYKKVNGRWLIIDAHEPLTLVVKGREKLNPRVFPDTIQLIKGQAPAHKNLQLTLE